MARDVEVLRESALRIVAQAGDCDEVECPECPLSVGENGAGCRAVQGGREDEHMNADITAARLAKEWLDPNPGNTACLCEDCPSVRYCDSEPDICGKTDLPAHKTAEQVSKSVHDMVNHPVHYTSHPSGVECIDVTKHMDFCIGNAIKYLWRNGLKGEDLKETIRDLKKAQWYIQCKIEMLEGKDE